MELGSDAASVDAVLSSFGIRRRLFPLGVYFFQFPIVMVFSWQMFVLSFSAWIPEIGCSDVAEGATPEPVGNSTRNCNDSFRAKSEETLVVEFELSGRDVDLVNMTNSCYMFGMLIANIFLGRLPDIFGRKPVMYLSLLILSILSFVSAAVQSIRQMMAVRFFCGMIYVTGAFAIFVYLPELFPTQHRVYPSQCVLLAWSLGVSSLSLLCYFLRGWRNIHLALGAANLLMLPLYFVTPESLVWLALNKRYKELETTVNRIRSNRLILVTKENVNPCVRNVEDEKEETSIALNGENKREPIVEESKSFWSKYGDATFCTNLLVFTFYWFVDGLIYFALQFSTQSFVGDRFLNFFLFAIVEVPGLLLAATLIRLTTRRFSLFFVHFLAGAAMVTLAVIRIIFPEVLKTHSEILISLNLVAKLSVTGAFSVMVLTSVEMFPTGVRIFASNMAAAGSRIAGIAAMFLPIVARQMESPLALELTFGILGILASLSTIWLVESLGHPVPQTMDDIRKMKKETKNLFKIF